MQVSTPAIRTIMAGLARYTLFPIGNNIRIAHRLAGGIDPGENHVSVCI